MRYPFIYLAFFCLFISCNRTNNVKEKSLAEIEQDSIKFLAEKLGLQNGFPQTFISTYEYQKYLKKNNKVLISKAYLVDLLERDSVLILSTQVTHFPELYMDIVCNETQIKDIVEELLSPGIHYQILENYYLIVEVTAIEKIKFRIDSSIEDDSFVSDDEKDYVPSNNVKLGIETGDSFVIQGVLLDLIKVKE